MVDLPRVQPTAPTARTSVGRFNVDLRTVIPEAQQAAARSLQTRALRQAESSVALAQIGAQNVEVGQELLRPLQNLLAFSFRASMQR